MEWTTYEVADASRFHNCSGQDGKPLVVVQGRTVNCRADYDQQFRETYAEEFTRGSIVKVLPEVSEPAVEPAPQLETPSTEASPEPGEPEPADEAAAEPPIDPPATTGRGRNKAQV